MTPPTRQSTPRRVAPARFRCQACGFTVFNRRLSHCESCGAALAEGQGLGPQDLARIEADDARVAKARAELKRESDALVRARMWRVHDGDEDEALP